MLNVSVLWPFNSSEELSEEDRALKEDLEMLVTRLQEKDQSLYAPSESSFFLLCTIIIQLVTPFVNRPPIGYLNPHILTSFNSSLL